MTKDQILNDGIWLALMAVFALVAAYPSVHGFASIAGLFGWLWVLLVIAASWVYLTAATTVEKGEDSAKRDTSLKLLRRVESKLATRSELRRVLGHVKLALLVVLMTYTGSVFLALVYLFARFMTSVTEQAGRKAIGVADSTGTPAPASPSTATPN